VYVVALADPAGPGGPGRLGFPRRVDPPGLDEGMHLSYAIQWFAFALIALVVGGVVGWEPNRRIT
jgi:cytochrome oxidase assembly protein ShyY1